MTSGTWVDAIAAYDQHGWTVGKAVTTRRTRREHLSLFGRTVGETDPWAVSPERLLGWFDGREWSIETHRSRRTTLRGFYAWAHAEGLVEVSPAARLPAVRPSRPNPRPVTDAVYAAAIGVAAERERLMLHLAGDHGLRRGEVAVVHSSDLIEDLDGWTLLVHGKGGRERTVPLTRSTAAKLRDLPEGWAFPGDVDGHLSPRWVGTLLRRALGGDWTGHKLRHRAALRVYEASSYDLALTQDFLGHDNPKTTRCYLPSDRGRMRTAVNDAAA